MTAITGQENIERFRLITLRAAVRIYVRTGGQMKASARLGPKVMARLAGEATGAKYPSSLKGMASALADLDALLE